MSFLKYFKKSEDKNRPNIISGVITLIFLVGTALWIAYDLIKTVMGQ